MPQISYDCPHCFTERAAFTAHNPVQRKPQEHFYICLFQCAVCGNGIVGLLSGPQVGVWFNQQAGMDILRQNPLAMLLNTWPQKPESSSPNATPENVSRYFLQAHSAFNRREWDGAGAMFRKSLDVSLRTLNPGAKGSIYDRIESLPEKAGVTVAMKKWAHEVRRLGADAAHDEDPFTEDEAKTISEFTEMFLTYAFSLPARLAASAPAAALPAS